MLMEAFTLAEQAVFADKNKIYDVACMLYTEVAQIFLSCLENETNLNRQQQLRTKAAEYISRAEYLKSQKEFMPAKQPKSLLENLLEQALFSFDQALDEDEKNNYEEAIYLYTLSAETYLKAVKETKNEEESSKLKQKISNIIDRAEQLKCIKNTVKEENQSQKPLINSNNSDLTPHELEVLRISSFVNNQKYLPWLSMDIHERFSYPNLFIDPDGLLELSLEQKVQFGGWKRPSQIMSDPQMIYYISSNSIIQDIVTDCSFVASLCVTSAYERKFKKPLITSCIYPQNKNGKPIYNPSGKYLIKLLFNGIHRKVIIDDLLPVSRTGKLMCTYTKNHNELWASIIEKAYMKLMGGYNFPGSNPGIDLYALTGWIPEMIFNKDKTFNQDSTWKRILNGLNYGDALITVSTGDLSPETCESLGLVPNHAYAVLDIKEVQGLRLLQVKNPWSHKRWKGPFSHLDNKNWTQSLKEALNYDQLGALQNDDGIFWINYESLCTYFDSIHINWNPSLFKYRFVMHVAWPSYAGPKKDHYNMGNNPQFGLKLNVTGNQGAAVWLLLSKHILKKEENKDYITLHLYDNTQCKRIYYPGKPLIPGVYINSPHILVRFNAPPGLTEYTVVVSQVEKKSSLNFTIRVYSVIPFEFFEIPRGSNFEKRISGFWTKENAGGNISHPTFYRNPQYKLSITPILPSSAKDASQDKINLIIMLEAPKSFPVNIKLVKSGKRISNCSSKELTGSSNSYRHGFCYLELDDIKPDDYTIIVSTFDPGLISGFFLTIGCSHNFTTSIIPPEGEGYQKYVLPGDWIENKSAMGCSLYKDYFKNPRYIIEASCPTKLFIRMQITKMNPIPAMNVSIFERISSSENKEIISSGPYTNTTQGVITKEILIYPDKVYFVVFSTWKPEPGKFVSYIYVDNPIKIKQIIE